MKLYDCFPTKWSFIVFISYMALFVNQGILVTATKEKGSSSYSYNTVTVVMFIECLKLVASLGAYLKQFSCLKLFEDIGMHSRVLLLYFVPAILYTVYNNLTFVNLSVFDPTTYYLLLQFRVVVTGIVFQLLFKKSLSHKQWFSLILLTLGCIVKQLHVPKVSTQPESTSSSSVSLHMDIYLLLILVQVFCSCFAGVYNEYLLKDAGSNVHIMLQNIFMYLDCIACNFVVLLFRGEVVIAFSNKSVQSVLRPLVIAVMVNGAACGIITSLFLKSLNSIMKTFASALELVFTAVLCWIIFGIPIDIFTILAIGIVSFATYLYSQNPVTNTGKVDRGHKDDQVNLLVGDDSV